MLELFLLTMLVGAIAGLLAGLFGLGGGVVIVPALAWLFSVEQFPEQQIMIMSVATSLATIIFTAISSVFSHYKLGNLLWPRVYRLSPGILIGAAVGAVLADYFVADTLKWIFIIYLLYVGFKMAWPQGGIKKTGRLNKKLDYFVSIGIGLCSALLGIGGGTLTVPYLVSRDVVMKNAVAVSSACGLPIAISGALAYIYLGWQDPSLPAWSLGYVYLPAMLGIVFCSVLTAPLGAMLANKLSAKKIKRYFSIVIFLIAIKMMIK